MTPDTYSALVESGRDLVRIHYPNAVENDAMRIAYRFANVTERFFDALRSGKGFSDAYPDFKRELDEIPEWFREYVETRGDMQ